MTKEPIKKSKRVKRPAKKSTNAPTIGVVIRDTLGVSVSKKKAPAKADRDKGIELLSDAALLEDAQLKKALKKSRQETHKLYASGLSEGADFESKVPDKSKSKSSDTSEGTGVTPGVPNVSKADSSESDNESWGNSKYDNESDDSNNEGSENDDDGCNDKTGWSKQSSFVSSNFASKFLILDNVLPVVDEVASMMNVKVRQEESSIQAPLLLSIPVTAILETSIVPATTEVSNFAPPMIKSMVTESLEHAVLAKESSQPKQLMR
ncbi:hypothetical protein Tco_0260263 [Tanacetum coccineum]